ncbi:MAG: twin-arginine translocation signal domain-containing protein, partial [Maioricimonas sp. JB049]
MSDQQRKLTRRRFLQHSAMGTVMSAAAAGIVHRTDAQTSSKKSGLVTPLSPGDPSPYAYHDEEW